MHVYSLTAIAKKKILQNLALTITNLRQNLLTKIPNSLNSNFITHFSVFVLIFILPLACSFPIPRFMNY